MSVPHRVEGFLPVGPVAKLISTVSKLALKILSLYMFYSKNFINCLLKIGLQDFVRLYIVNIRIVDTFQKGL